MIDARQNVHLQNTQVNILEDDFQIQENDMRIHNTQTRNLVKYFKLEEIALTWCSKVFTLKHSFIINLSRCLTWGIVRVMAQCSHLCSIFYKLNQDLFSHPYWGCFITTAKLKLHERKGSISKSNSVSGSMEIHHQFVKRNNWSKTLPEIESESVDSGRDLSLSLLSCCIFTFLCCQLQLVCSVEVPLQSLS